MVMPNSIQSTAVNTQSSQAEQKPSEGKLGEKAAQHILTDSKALETASKTDVEANSTLKFKEAKVVQSEGGASVVVRQNSESEQLYVRPKSYRDALLTNLVNSDGVAATNAISENLSTGVNSSPLIKHSLLNPETPIGKLSMLGSHDAGTFAFSRKESGLGSLGSFVPGQFKTQNLNLVQQAEAGATYFDIRVTLSKSSGKHEFFHDISSAGDAEKHVKDLLQHAVNDSDNIYLLKFDLKKGGSDFLEKVLTEDVNSHLIKKDNDKNIAELKLSDTLHKGKNIGLMFKAPGDDDDFSYKQETHTKWADKNNVKDTVDFLKEFHQESMVSGNKLNIMQTNMPGKGTESVKPLVTRGAEELANTVKDLPPGIISGDYIGLEEGPYGSYIDIINTNNDNLINKPKGFMTKI
ncbi:hypothetical protein BS333_05905 [Vibrio azureus]|uniref:Phosphatidylinositol diacylglycerol-lyase n=2 Tax=Vibrio azureus TaxID=512649 RepID=U3BY60_9VIBR|nr:hypothetical protein [Vibrio azureus]AUI85952.1 hypothetical protein BS333_05905 [Vibrio azureus]GAD74259.1 hypothetical protein VAZ01S_008_00010 [Vibrio azureus NBRC 104587]